MQGAGDTALLHQFLATVRSNSEATTCNGPSSHVTPFERFTPVSSQNVHSVCSYDKWREQLSDSLLG
jgi:hypothetical protein